MALRRERVVGFLTEVGAKRCWNRPGRAL